MSFALICAKCKRESPPVESSLPPPSGWKSETKSSPDGKVVVSFVCPTC